LTPNPIAYLHRSGVKPLSIKVLANDGLVEPNTATKQVISPAISEVQHLKSRG